MQFLAFAVIVACAQALQLPVCSSATSAIAASRTPVPTMKHKDYFTRIARAEGGRLRLSVSRSNNHIYGQIIDDTKDAVVVAASTMEKEVREEIPNGGNSAAATAVGKRLAAKALAKGIEQVYFDRNGKRYHGRIAALADGAREAGLSF